MKHDFINDQIWHAAKQAALATDYYKIVPTNYLQAFINALLDPSYPEIALDDVRKGDRVRITTGMGNQYEVTFDRMDSYTWRWNGGAVYIDAIERIYLMDRPVVHPDPAEHPVILVTEYDVAGNIMECEPTPFFAHDGVYKNDIYAHRPDDVLSWSPAKVVADDEM